MPVLFYRTQVVITARERGGGGEGRGAGRVRPQVQHDCNTNVKMCVY